MATPRLDLVQVEADDPERKGEQPLAGNDGPARYRGGKQARERPVVPLGEEAHGAELGREEEKENRHPCGEKGLVVELAASGRLARDLDRHWRASGGCLQPANGSAAERAALRESRCDRQLHCSQLAGKSTGGRARDLTTDGRIGTLNDINLRGPSLSHGGGEPGWDQERGIDVAVSRLCRGLGRVGHVNYLGETGVCHPTKHPIDE